MRTPSRAVSLLFLVALLGVLGAGGVLAAAWGGLALLLAYAAAAGLLVGLGIVKARRFVPRPAPPIRACTCCDGDHTRPVEIV